MPNKTSKKRKIPRKLRKAAANTSVHVDYSSSSRANTTKTAGEYLENPIQSDADKNQYRVVKLSNGLIATLVSSCGNDPQKENMCHAKNAKRDAESKLHQAAPAKGKNNFEWFSQCIGRADKDRICVTCCLCIDVGSFSNPSNVPYVSQVLSRVILQPSKKWPQNKSFVNFMKQIGSVCEIRPQNDFTFFSFNVPIFYACEAIDRFTSCFVDLSLSPEMIFTEREIVQEEEIELKIKQLIFGDPSESIIHDIASRTKTHPGYENAKCSPENVYKTGSKFLEEVKTFMKRHYSAHRMTLVLQAEMPLDSLEKCVRQYFQKIPNNDVPPADLSSYSYDQCFDIREFNLLYVLEPTRTSGNKIVFDWVMPPAQALYRSKPHQFISRLLQDETPGSLLYYLRSRWCCFVESGIREDNIGNNSIYSLFRLSLDLPRDGIAHAKDVIDAVYSYVSFLKLEGIQKGLYEERRQIEKNLFSINSYHDSLDFNLELSKNMHLYPSADYITGNFLYYDYDPNAIKLCLNSMSPERANIKLYGENLNGFDHFLDIVESRDNKFRKIKIPEGWINDWRVVSPLPNFKFPQPNIFCPEDSDLVAAPKLIPRYPIKIHSDSLCEIWHKLDDKYRTPGCIINLHYNSRTSIDSAEGAVMLDMFCNFLLDVLRGKLQFTSSLGIRFMIHPTGLGIQVEAKGCNETLPRNFIPPSSPHCGGIWEAAVKTCKRHLKRVMGNELFTYEQLNTLCIKIEAVLNSRPLTALSSDPNDLEALTPAHFLHGDINRDVPAPNWTDTPVNHLSCWQHLEQIKQHFWNRWYKEYLNELNVRKKWTNGGHDITVGSLVLIRDDNLPPLRWRLGRVIETFPGSDGIIRKVKLRTNHGITERNVRRVAPLPVEIPRADTS